MEQQDGEGTLHEFARTSFYKGTANADVVVGRQIVLYKEGKFVTFSERAPDSKTSWWMDHECELRPKNADDIVACTKAIRPPKTWTLTATLLRDMEQVQLYHFTLSWPLSWAPKGYTYFTFGSVDRDEARRWHQYFKDTLLVMRERHHKHHLHVPHVHHHKTSDDASMRGDTTATDVSVAGGRERVSPNGNADIVSQSFAPVQYGANPAATAAEAAYAHSTGGGPNPTYDGDDTDTESVFNGCGGEDSSRRTASLLDAMSDCWVPYKHTNGVAVYHHSQPDDGSGIGGEYMVSAPVRGSPKTVLDVLMHNSTNMTILGPVSEMEVLSKADPQDTESHKEVLRIVLEAPGWAGLLCAPREIVVERLLKKDDSSVHVVMFNSVERVKPVDETTKQPTTTQKSRHRHSLYTKPVPGKVRGGYTISPLEGCSLDKSQDALITCIIKVDLGGACGENAWSKPMADLFGWTDAFLDRILMSVILIRDAVEHTRYARNPFAMRSSITEADKMPPQRDMFKLTKAKMGSKIYYRAASQREQALAPQEQAGLPSTAAITTITYTAAAAPAPSAAGPTTAFAAGVDPNSGPLDLDYIRSLATMDKKFWDELHVPGKAAPFSVRGPKYLKDKKKMPAGRAMFTLAAVDVVVTKQYTQHLARFLPSIRKSGMPFGIVIQLVLPGNPMLAFVVTFITDVHPDELGEPPADPMAGNHDWQPFDFVLHKFLKGNTATRDHMLKLIPHVAEGSWMIKQSVGTTPVITGKALKTSYHQTPQYLEIDIDVSANSVANYATGMVRGATKSLAVDLGFVLEGTAPWELPEALLGTVRVDHIDLSQAKTVDLVNEIPMRPPYQGKAPSNRGSANNLARMQ